MTQTLETYDLSSGATTLQALNVNGYSLLIQLITTGGSVDGTVRFEGSTDGAQWHEILDTSTGTAIEVTLSEATTYGENLEGLVIGQKIRVKVTAGTAGNLTVKYVG